MKNFKLRQHTIRVLLFFHFIGLAATLGARFGIGVIDGATRTAGLPAVLLGRDLIDASQRQVILPGFLTVIATGIAMTLLRYGRRPPKWIWIKAGLVVVMLGIGILGVGPAVADAKEWAHWSAQHGQVASQLLEDIGRSVVFGSVVRILFLLTIGVAIWKPFLASGRRNTKTTIDKAGEASAS